MSKNIKFTLLIDEKERQTLQALSERLQRSKSNTIRLLIRQAALEVHAADVRAKLDDPPKGDGRNDGR
jgi:hypothetical protein